MAEDKIDEVKESQPNPRNEKDQGKQDNSGKVVAVKVESQELLVDQQMQKVQQTTEAMAEEAESEGKEVTEKLEQTVTVNLKAEKGEFKQVWKLAVGLLLIFLAITGGYLVFKNGLITGLLE